MDFSLSEEQELFQNTVRGFVAKECPAQTLRAVFDGKPQAASALWRGLAEMGVAGLVIPEAHGGAGLELLDLALVAEELGRGAVPVPFLGHALATLALARGGSAAQQAKWLPRLATGKARGTVAIGETDGSWLPATTNTSTRGTSTATTNTSPQERVASGWSSVLYRYGASCGRLGSTIGTHTPSPGADHCFSAGPGSFGRNAGILAASAGPGVAAATDAAGTAQYALGVSCVRVTRLTRSSTP